MGMIDSAIIAICLGTHGSTHDACVKSLDAGTRQYGIRQEVEKIESNANNYLNMQARNELTKEQLAILSSAGFIARVVRNKYLLVRLPNFGVCNSLKGELTEDKYSLRAQWDF